MRVIPTMALEFGVQWRTLWAQRVPGVPVRYHINYRDWHRHSSNTLVLRPQLLRSQAF